jgi:ATP-binding cassette subfamily C protein CydC
VVGTAQARAAMSEEVLALFDSLPELTVAGRAGERVARIGRSDDELSRGLDRAARPAAWAAGLGSAVMSAAVLGCLVVGSQAVASGRIREVTLAVLVFVPLAFAEVIAGLPAAAVSLVRAGEAARRLAPLLQMPRPEVDPGVLARPVPIGLRRGRRGLRIVPGQPELPGLHLRAQNLGVGWPGREVAVRGVDLDLSPGRRIAVVGPSGQGKSTLLRTLGGLLPPVEGRMSMDGTDVGDKVDLTHVHPRSLRHHVHLTAEDAHVFGTTVRENLRVAAKGATDADLVAALERAGLGCWIDGLTDGDRRGLDVVVGDPAGPGQGAGTHLLSGGIRRRLLLARAFVSGASVLLVDEPAEHLDPATADDLVREVLVALEPGRTAVVVTHRLTPLALADEVLVIDNGVVTARGTHDELIAAYPPYRSAWAAELSEQTV